MFQGSGGTFAEKEEIKEGQEEAQDNEANKQPKPKVSIPASKQAIKQSSKAASKQVKIHGSKPPSKFVSIGQPPAKGQSHAENGCLSFQIHPSVCASLPDPDPSRQN